MHKLKVKKLHINSFRALKNISLNFDDNYNEITGMNGTGKSSILDAIRYMISQNDINNKKMINTKTINPNHNKYKDSELLPNIELVLSYDDNELKLETDSKNWYINGIKQSNRSSYLSSLYEKLSIQQDDFLRSFNPFIMDYYLSSERKNNENIEIKNNIINIANILEKENKIIEPKEYNQILEQIENIKEERKFILDSIKEKENEKQWFIQYNNIENINVNNFDIEKEEKQQVERLQELKIKESKFDQINLDINNKESEYTSIDNRIKELERKLNKFKNGEYVNKQNISSKIKLSEKILLIILYFLFIIPGLIYKKYLIKKYNNNNDFQDELIIKEIRNIENDINDLKKEKDRIEKAIDDLKNNIFYKDVDVAKIRNEIFTLEKLLNKNEMNEKILELKNIDSDIEELREELKTIDFNLNKQEEHKNNINKKTSAIIKKYFPNFDVSLFNDEKNDEALIIKKDNIPLNCMNYSQKMNVIFELNNFLKHKRNIEVFFLIDGGESFNKITSTNQVIVAKVNNEKDLKLNGKNIY